MADTYKMGKDDFVKITIRMVDRLQSTEDRSSKLFS